MKKISFLFLVMGFVLLFISRTEAGKVAVEVKVKVSSNNTVDSVQVGKNGSYLTRDQINRNFDVNKDGRVTVNEFNNRKNAFGQRLSAQPVNIKLGNGMTQYDAQKTLNIMDNAKQYMAENNFSYKPTSIISLGDNGHGNYATQNETHFSNLSLQSVTEKVTQSAVLGKYQNIGYTGVEAYGRYYKDAIIKNNSAGNNIYNPQYESLNGNDIYNAYTNYQNGKITKDQLQAIINNTANNNLAISESLSQIRNVVGAGQTDEIVNQSLVNIRNINNPTGKQIYNAVVKADQQVNNGNDTTTIKKIFSNHGI